MENKPVREMVSEAAFKTMKESNIKLVYDYNDESKKNKYSKQFNLKLFQGYDILENLIVVRPYIQKKYNIDLNMLEILVYLYARKFFVQADYTDMPKQFSYRSIRNMLDTKFISIVQHGGDLSKHIYRINQSGAHIVKEFYELLSGERKFPEDHTNPLARKKTRTKFDKRKMDLILKINQAPAPDKKKPLYE